jgi:hypothetical protein
MPRRQRYEWLYRCSNPQCGHEYRSPMKVSQVWCQKHKHERGGAPAMQFVGQIDNFPQEAAK